MHVRPKRTAGQTAPLTFANAANTDAPNSFTSEWMNHCPATAHALSDAASMRNTRRAARVAKAVMKSRHIKGVTEDSRQEPQLTQIVGLYLEVLYSLKSTSFRPRVRLAQGTTRPTWIKRLGPVRLFDEIGPVIENSVIADAAHHPLLRNSFHQLPGPRRRHTSSWSSSPASGQRKSSSSTSRNGQNYQVITQQDATSQRLSPKRISWRYCGRGRYGRYTRQTSRRQHPLLWFFLARAFSSISMMPPPWRKAHQNAGAQTLESATMPPPTASSPLVP